MAAERAELECLLRMFDNGNLFSFSFAERLQFRQMIKNGTTSVHLGKISEAHGNYTKMERWQRKGMR